MKSSFVFLLLFSSSLQAQSYHAETRQTGTGRATARLQENRDNSPRAIEPTSDVNSISVESNIDVSSFDEEFQVIEIESLVYGIPATEIDGSGQLGIPGGDVGSKSFSISMQVDPVQVSLTEPVKMLAQEVHTQEWTVTGLRSDDFEISTISGTYTIETSFDSVNGEFSFDASVLSFDNVHVNGTDNPIYDQWFVDDGELLADTHLRDRGIRMRIENTENAIYTGIIHGVAVELFLPSYLYEINGLLYTVIPEKAVMVLGDSNNDGIFNSRDLVVVFEAGFYETDFPSTWETGDWNEDGFFNSGDLVVAFQAGTYTEAVVPKSVPEPTFGWMFVATIPFLIRCKKILSF